MKPPVEILIDTYQNNLYAVAFNICKNSQDAEDVLQETFIQYWQYQKEFDSEQHIRAWLFRVAINKSKNKVSSFFRHNTVSLDDYMESLTFATPEASDLFNAVMQLPDKYRLVIHLFYYEDYTIAEIAEILSIMPGSVKTRLSRGRVMLRNMLKEAWNDDE